MSSMAFRSTTAWETERVIREFFDDDRAGGEVACYRLSFGFAFVLGRTLREAINHCKDHYGGRWVLFRQERWVGGLWSGRWLRVDED